MLLARLSDSIPAAVTGGGDGADEARKSRRPRGAGLLRGDSHAEAFLDGEGSCSGRAVVPCSPRELPA
jgi:hypothetical protein